MTNRIFRAIRAGSKAARLEWRRPSACWITVYNGGGSGASGGAAIQYKRHTYD